MRSVVGEGFCVPYLIELIVKKRRKGLLDPHFEVLDVYENLHLQVDGTHFAFNYKGVMHGPAGFPVQPVLTLHTKAITAPNYWTVHRGESLGIHNLLFSVQRCHPHQETTLLHVFLPSNINDMMSNFQVVACHSSWSSRVYKGDTLIAEVNRDITRRSKDTFKVKVYPGVDYAFIVTLMVILDEGYII